MGQRSNSDVHVKLFGAVETRSEPEFWMIQPKSQRVVDHYAKWPQTG